MAEQKLKNFDAPTMDFIEQKSKEFIKLMSYCKCAMMEIETKLNILNLEYSMKNDRNPISSIKTRLKEPESIRKKLERKGFIPSIENMERELNDIAGIRVICSFPEDVYTISNALLSQDDVTLIEMKDYIKNPKPNGYRSLHIIIGIPIFLSSEKKMMRVEIQLRTIAMDFWASLEHQIRYKKDTEFTATMAAELALCAELSADLDAKMDNLRKQVLVLSKDKNEI